MNCTPCNRELTFRHAAHGGGIGNEVGSNADLPGDFLGVVDSNRDVMRTALSASDGKHQRSESIDGR